MSSANKQIPTLASLSFEAGLKSLASDHARAFLADTKGAPNADDIDMIKYVEMVHREEARDRIVGTVNDARLPEYSSDRWIMTSYDRVPCSDSPLMQRFVCMAVKDFRRGDQSSPLSEEEENRQ